MMTDPYYRMVVHKQNVVTKKLGGGTTQTIYQKIIQLAYLAAWTSNTKCLAVEYQEMLQQKSRLFGGKYWIQKILTLDSASVVLDILRNLMGSLMYGELYGIMARLDMSGIMRDL